jgi:N-methylhydantoinase A
MFYAGTDIGGTFTDAVVLDEDGNSRVFKAPTTPQDRSVGVLNVLEIAAASYGLDVRSFVAQLRYFAHGTTTATNALIERKGVPTGLITTVGFRDTLLLQRTMGSWAGMGDEFTHYSIRRNPEPLVPRRLIREVTERIDYKGQVLVALNEEELRAAIRDLVARGIEALAVCFVWSFVNPSHERRAGEIIRQEAPRLFYSLSHELVAVLGEYERTATTVINAYLGPTIRDYVNRLHGRLTDHGFSGTCSIMDSGGGVMLAAEAGDRPVRILNSGPAGGVLASAALAKALGIKNVITTDMGGTSFDVGLIVDGQPLISSLSEAARYHLIQPVIAVNAIGSGGGSIARVEDGHLFVGPHSAGADPGPACYGKGGTRPTVTDADVVLGVIDPDYFLGGQMRLQRELAEQAIRTHVAEPLGISVLEAAAGVREIADHQMADLLRNVTIQQGYDPREFVLFAYGGAGPTHCHRYAADLGVQSVIIPAAATGWSAYGAVTSDRHYSCSTTALLRTAPGFQAPSQSLPADRITANFERLEAEARAALGEDSAPVETRRFVSMRYRRQVNEVSVEAPAGLLGPAEIDEVVGRFERKYEELFGKGTGLRAAGIEMTTFRVEATVPVTRPALRPAPADATAPPAARIGARPVYQQDGVVSEVGVYRGERLAPGSCVAGPAIIEHPGTTIVIGPHQSARIDAYRNSVLTTAHPSGQESG